MPFLQHLNCHIHMISNSVSYLKSLYIDLALTIYFTLELPKLYFMLSNEKYYLNPLFKNPSSEDVPLASDKFWLAVHLLIVGILLVNLYRIYYNHRLLTSPTFTATKVYHYINLMMVFFNCTNLVGLNLMTAVAINLGVSCLLCYFFNKINIYRSIDDDVFRYFFALSLLSFVAGIYGLAEYTLTSLNLFPLIIFSCFFLFIH